MMEGQDKFEMNFKDAWEAGYPEFYNGMLKILNLWWEARAEDQNTNKSRPE